MPIQQSECTDLAEAISQRLPLGCRIETLREVRRTGKAIVPDATSAFFLDGTTRRGDCVIIVSPHGFPSMARRGAVGALAAQAALGEDLGRHVCAPLLLDDWNGRSFAVYPRHCGYSRNRYLRRAETLATAPAILDWLAAIFHRTRQDCRSPTVLSNRFAAPLHALASDPDVDPATRQASRSAAFALDSGRVRATICLQHCDFWHGNILFARAPVDTLSPALRNFRIIDWAASKPDGHPGIDAIRFLISAFGTGPQSGRGIARYCAATGLSRTDIALGCLASLGRLSGELDNFPKPRFLVLLNRVHGFLHSNGMLAGLPAPPVRS